MAGFKKNVSTRKQKIKQRHQSRDKKTKLSKTGKAMHHMTVAKKTMELGGMLNKII
ncbi:unnamed protein product, partial [Laminaria digitata]